MSTNPDSSGDDLLLLDPTPSPNPLKDCRFNAYCHVRCVNTCRVPNDNTCDDGGDGALWGMCETGTDCEDCGPRNMYSPPVPPLSPPQPPWPPRPPLMPDLVFYNPYNMGGVEVAVCPGGVPEATFPTPFYVACNNDCFVQRHGIGNGFVKDGICDDGVNNNWGPCPVGTDCDDCGPRCIHHNYPPATPPTPNPPPLPSKPPPPPGSPSPPPPTPNPPSVSPQTELPSQGANITDGNSQLTATQDSTLVTLAIAFGALFGIMLVVLLCWCWMRGKCGASHKRMGRRLPQVRRQKPNIVKISSTDEVSVKEFDFDVTAEEDVELSGLKSGD